MKVYKLKWKKIDITLFAPGSVHFLSVEGTNSTKCCLETTNLFVLFKICMHFLYPRHIDDIFFLTSLKVDDKNSIKFLWKIEIPRIRCACHDESYIS